MSSVILTVVICLLLFLGEANGFCVSFPRRKSSVSLQRAQFASRASFRKSVPLCAVTEDKIAEKLGSSGKRSSLVVNGDDNERAWSVIRDSDVNGAPIGAMSVNSTVQTVTPSSLSVAPEQELALSPANTTATVVTSTTTILRPKRGPAADSFAENEALKAAIADAAQRAVDEVMDDTCAVGDDGLAQDELCSDDEGKMTKAKNALKSVIGKTIGMVRRGDDDSDSDSDTDDGIGAIFGTGVLDTEGIPGGDALEKGWEKRANSSALRRNAEVWKFALQCVFKVLKPRKLRKKEAPESEIKAAQREAATFIRDGLLKLGPSFVKLGQVVSTRTDVLSVEYTDVLKTLQDEVPGFSGKKAKEIVTRELGRNCDKVFRNFSRKPLAAASLGQVHTAIYNGTKVAVKVQRAGLKELFDIDLKNLKKVAELLDKFDPKTDGADRNWVTIYEESERLLYQEIDYIHEAENTERFTRDFADIDWVRIPKVYRDVTTERVLTMEFVQATKLTDIKKVERLGLDKKLMAQRTADSFLRQIIETGYFHCDPHPGNIGTDDQGNLVYYDFGMMDELRPNVQAGFRKFCTALFAGGPMISDLELSRNAKMLVDGVEEAGVLARGADRLAVEKLARYFMRTFKDQQLGKKGANIKKAVGSDLQTLTENNVFRFPSTFTFIFRAFASIDGIGKGLDPEYDIGKLAQPFVEKFTDSQKGYQSEWEKKFATFTKATGLNAKDVNTAITAPKKIAYIEETIRTMENGSLKIRVRSLENEKALERMALTQGRMESILLASLLLNFVCAFSRPILSGAGAVGAAVFGIKAFLDNMKIKKFDKTQAKFTQTSFQDDE